MELLLAIAIMALGAVVLGAALGYASIKFKVEGNPLVELKVQLKVGSANDPAGKEGLAYLTFNLLANGGSRTKTYEEITRAFYPMAAEVSLRVDKEMSVFAGLVHRDNLEKYYGLLKEMLLDPGFREADFNRLKTNQVNFLEKTLVNNMDEQFGKDGLFVRFQLHLFIKEMTVFRHPAAVGGF